MAESSRVMLATWHWHIEISSKCTLQCPRCARQEVPNNLINTELNLDFFKRNFTPEFIRTNVEKVTFCGNDGDPIYAHDLISVINYFKSIKNIEIVIITNGSYKQTSWWADLGLSLTEYDSVHFSVDGYDNNSNNLYRVNSDYNSIIAGIRALRASSRCQIIWAAIGFAFNQDHLGIMAETAESLGCDRFQLTRSTKFSKVYPSYGVADPLQPRDGLISSTHRFEREVIQFTNKATSIHPINLDLYQKYQHNTDIVPLCSIGNKGLYIDAQGRLFPCCWVSNRYSHNTEWQEIANRFNLHNTNIADALSDTFWTTEFSQYKWQECRAKCSSRVVNQDYAIQW